MTQQAQPTEVLRAFRYAMDPTPGQRKELERHAGASRWAFNWALAQKRDSYEAWRSGVAQLRETGLTEEQARAAFKQQGADLIAQANLYDGYRGALFRAVKGHTSGTDAVPQRIAALNDEIADLAGQDDDQVDDKARRRIDKLNQEKANLLAATDGYPLDIADLRKRLNGLRTKVTAMRADLYTKGYKTPSGMDVPTQWRTVRDLPREEGGSPWWEDVNSYCFTSGFSNADSAWQNWLDSYSGKRAGRRVGFPRFKKRGRARESFTLYHDVKKPSIRPEQGKRRYITRNSNGDVVKLNGKPVPTSGYRGLLLPRLGYVRLHSSTKRLTRMIQRGHAVVQSVTISRSGDRWYASVLCKVQQDIPEKPTRRQKETGTVAVKWDTNRLTLHTGTGFKEINQPRYLRAKAKAVKKAQRKASKTSPGSARRAKANRRVGRLTSHVAERRKGWLHQVTAYLSKGHDNVIIEDLPIQEMVKAEKPRALTRSRNQAILDSSPGEFARQLAYKTTWFGSKLTVVSPADTTRTCSKCGKRNPSDTPPGQVFRCCHCSYAAPRQRNAAINISKAATPADTQQAAPDTTNRGGSKRPRSPRKTNPPGVRQRAVIREDSQEPGPDRSP